MSGGVETETGWLAGKPWSSPSEIMTVAYLVKTLPTFPLYFQSFEPRLHSFMRFGDHFNIILPSTPRFSKQSVTF
jgi:hypothetical protein